MICGGKGTIMPFFHSSLSMELGNVHTKWKTYVFLLLTISIVGGAPGVCPPACVCASEIVSCTNRNLSIVPRTIFKFIRKLDLSYNKIGFLDPDWFPVMFDKLHTLILHHNTISSISGDSFSTLRNVRYLDLSSNNLRTLSNPVFQELKMLEELLLYNNQLTNIDSGAFGGLHKLQKLYLSYNALAHFPLDLYVGRNKLSELVLLDISHNNFQSVPVQDISLISARQLSGIYLHENPFFCDCQLNTMLNFWYRRHFTPVVDFKSFYKCTLPSESKRMPLIQENFLNCSENTVNETYHAFGLLYEVQIGERLVVHCDSKIVDRDTQYIWTGPQGIKMEAEKKTDHFRVFFNGSLEIEEVQVVDSGIYSCTAINRLVNETIDIRLTVGNFTSHKSHSHEAFNTAFTTLAACVVSIILVLLYLYLTPCRCCCKSKKNKRKQNQNSAHSSILSATPSHEPQAERKSSTGKRVVFLEPVKGTEQGQNGKVRLLPNENLTADSILKNSRSKSDSDSVNSVFSDAPFIAPV